MKKLIVISVIAFLLCSCGAESKNNRESVFTPDGSVTTPATESVTYSQTTLPETSAELTTATEESTAVNAEAVTTTATSAATTVSETTAEEKTSAPENTTTTAPTTVETEASVYDEAPIEFISGIPVYQKNDIKLTIDSDTLTRTGTTYIIANDCGYDIIFGVGQDFVMQKYDGGEWTVINVYPFDVPSEGRDLLSGGSVSQQTTWTELESGSYRLLKRITVNYEAYYLTAEFTIS